MQTIIKRTHCLLAHSGLSPSLWADTASFSIYTGNLIPSARHPGHIPTEKWTNKCQDVSHLHPFGCTVYAKIPEEIGTSKLVPQSIKYILIGYFGWGTYKLWDQASGTMIKTHDIIFEEGKGHRTISDAPTPVFDNKTAPAPSHNANAMSAGIVVPPKPLAPCPCTTDPPLHPESMTSVTPNVASTSQGKPLMLCSPCHFGNCHTYTQYNHSPHHTPWFPNPS